MANFLEEIKRKLKTRKTGRVVRMEIEEGYDKWMLNLLKKRWEIEEENIFKVEQQSLMDFSALWQIIKHNEFKDRLPDSAAHGAAPYLSGAGPDRKYI